MSGIQGQKQMIRGKSALFIFHTEANEKKLCLYLSTICAINKYFTKNAETFAKHQLVFIR